MCHPSSFGFGTELLITFALLESPLSSTCDLLTDPVRFEKKGELLWLNYHESFHALEGSSSILLTPYEYLNAFIVLCDVA